MCDFCFMKGLDLHFTCLRSLFSLIDCWLISSQVMSLTPLDLSKSSQFNSSRSSSKCAISFLSQGEPESPALGPDSPDCPDTPALRPDTPGGKTWIYITRGVGINRFLGSFYCRRHSSPPHSHSRPRGDSNLPSIKNSSVFEGRFSFPLETPRKLWI